MVLHRVWSLRLDGPAVSLKFIALLAQPWLRQHTRESSQANMSISAKHT
jgi:hypothetical protein